MFPCRTELRNSEAIILNRYQVWQSKEKKHSTTTRTAAKGIFCGEKQKNSVVNCFFGIAIEIFFFFFTPLTFLSPQCFLSWLTDSSSMLLLRCSNGRLIDTWKNTYPCMCSFFFAAQNYIEKSNNPEPYITHLNGFMWILV